MKRILLILTILLLGSCYQYIVDKKKLDYKLQLEHKTGVIVYLPKVREFESLEVPGPNYRVKEVIKQSMEKIKEESGGRVELIGIYGYDGVFDEAFEIKRQKKKNIIELSYDRGMSRVSLTVFLYLFSAGLFPFTQETIRPVSVKYYDSDGKETVFAQSLLLNGYPVFRYFASWFAVPLIPFSKDNELTFYQHSFEYNLTEFTKKVFEIKKSKADYELFPPDKKILVQVEITDFQFGEKAGGDMKMDTSPGKKKQYRYVGCSTEDSELMCVGVRVHLKNKTGKNILYSPENYTIIVNGKEYKIMEAFTKNMILIEKDYTIELLPDSYGSFFITFLVPRKGNSIKLIYRDKKASILYEKELLK